jgi:hypothetical protein
MGYQFVEVKVKDRDLRREVLVFNGEFAAESGGRIIVREGMQEVQKRRLQLALQVPDDGVSLRVLTRTEAVTKGLLESSGYRAKGATASDGAIELSRYEEPFLRFSAFADDLRILPDGSVRPGTYVTTHDDGTTFVKTGMDAVRRYALPNPDPAVHRFQSQAARADPRPARHRATGKQPARWRCRSYLREGRAGRHQIQAGQDPTGSMSGLCD